MENQQPKKVLAKLSADELLRFQRLKAKEEAVAKSTQSLMRAIMDVTREEREAIAAQGQALIAEIVQKYKLDGHFSLNQITGEVEPCTHEHETDNPVIEALRRMGAHVEKIEFPHDPTKLN